MAIRGEEIRISSNKINEILTAYLRKRQVYKCWAQINDFGGLEVLAVKLVSTLAIGKEYS